MRIISPVISILIATSIFSCNTEPAGFTINARVADVSDGTIFYLMNWDDNTVIDSSDVRNGTFYLKGHLSGTKNLLLHATDSLTKEFIYTNLIIGNENVTIAADKSDFPWNINVSGSQSQDIAEKFNRIEYQKQQRTKYIRESFDGPLAGTGEEERAKNRIKQVSDSLDETKIELIKTHFNSYAALINFKHYKNHFSSADLTGLYETLSPELKRTAYARAIKTQIEYPPRQIGEAYYDYKSVNQTGDTVSLSQINNKYILLHFSSAGCYYSQQSLTELRDIYKRYKDKLEIVKISEDISKDVWKQSIERDSIDWTNLWDGNGEYNDAVIKYGTIGTPNYILISPAKIILDKWFGYSPGTIREKLEEHL